MKSRVNFSKHGFFNTLLEKSISPHRNRQQAAIAALSFSARQLKFDSHALPT